jgi:hypothetical protein
MRQNFVVSDLEYFKICLLLSGGGVGRGGEGIVIHARGSRVSKSSDWLGLRRRKEEAGSWAIIKRAFIPIHFSFLDSICTGSECKR